MKDVPRTIHRGITVDAQKLGVHRIHLWLVLTGRRQSRCLLRRYRELKQQPEPVQAARFGRPKGGRA